MTFLHPLLLAGLALAAIPALLHLLERQHPPEAEFPALRYLSEAERQSARRVRLRHLLLLVLRTALLVLVVLAAARPLVPLRVKSVGGGHEPTALAVVLDNSPSSGVIMDGRPLFERLRATARGSIAAAGTNDHLWLVMADGVVRKGTRQSLLGILDSTRVQSERLELGAVVARAIRVVDADPLPAHEVHVVSDLQRTAFGSTRVTRTPRVRVLILAPLARPPANRGIGVVKVADGVATVPMVGTAGTPPGAVTVRVGPQVIARGLGAPGTAVTAPLPQLGDGWWVGEAALDPDELRGDDRRLFAWHDAPAARVRVTGDPGPFVTAALGVLREGKRVNDAGRSPEISIGDRMGAGPSAVGGGTILIPPGDRAMLGETNRALALRGSAWRFAGPATPGLIQGRSELSLLDSVPVRLRYRLERAAGPSGAAAPDSMVLATVNGEPWLVRDSSTVILASRLDTGWTALPTAPAFVPFLDQLINHVGRGEAAISSAEGPVHIEFRTRGSDTLGATVYGPDPRESDLEPATPGQVEETLGALPLDERRFLADRFTGSRRADASGWLLGLALALAIVEFGVATVLR
ncbi:MAG TPA: BatA domain-containing protein [Gemmatimonadales bacterium]|nr:BatA domain-containing protein [Gemmatimonadales bacterium]